MKAKIESISDTGDHIVVYFEPKELSYADAADWLAEIDKGVVLKPIIPVKVIFNGPATIMIWSDGIKTVVKCQEGDEFNPEYGILACIAKRFYGNRGKYNDIVKDAIKTATVGDISAIGVVEEK